MRNRLVFSSLLALGLVFFLAGCASQDPAIEELMEKNEKRDGIISQKFDTLDSAKQNINGAVEKKNADIEEALGIGEETMKKGESINTNEKKMDNVPEQIDMALAESCVGAKLVTNNGVIELTFHPEKAPIAVANFCTLAKQGFYDGVIFHRVIQGFMIQGGDPQGTGTGGPGYKFADELPAQGEYKLGSLAMANAGPNTNGSQFFIVSGPNGVGLPPAYTLFGEVKVGMDVVTKIENVATAIGDKPLEDVVIEKVELLTK